MTHKVSGRHPEVDGDGCERERSSGELRLVDPAAEGLQGGRAVLKLLPKRQQQKQDINTAASQELGHHWANPGSGDEHLDDHQQHQQDEGANHVGLEKFVSHLGVLEKRHTLIKVRWASSAEGPASTSERKVLTFPSMWESLNT